MSAFSGLSFQRIAAEIDEAVAAVTSGQDDWTLVGEAFCRLFPGATFSLASHAPGLQTPCPTFGANFDPDFVKSFAEFYGLLSPRKAIWDRLPSGGILVSEKDHPSSLMKGTVFYEEWVRPQKDIEAAAGMKLAGRSGSFIQVSSHYPLQLAADYDYVIPQVWGQLRPTLSQVAERTVSLGQAWLDGAVDGAFHSLEVDSLATLLDGNRHILRSTEKAEAELHKGELLASSSGLLRMVDPGMDNWLTLALRQLGQERLDRSTSSLFDIGGSLWKLLLWAPPLPRHLLPVLESGRYVLELRAADRFDAARGIELLQARFGLSPAEARMCKALAEGLSMAEAAVVFGVSKNTVRVQVQSAMSKMDCHRQSDLVRKVLGYSLL